jgi:hypothetical protein
MLSCQINYFEAFQNDSDGFKLNGEYRVCEDSDGQATLRVEFGTEAPPDTDLGQEGFAVAWGVQGDPETTVNTFVSLYSYMSITREFKWTNTGYTAPQTI